MQADGIRVVGLWHSQRKPIPVIQRFEFSSFAKVIQVSEIIKTATRVNQPLCQVFEKHVYDSGNNYSINESDT
jgi:hypothetical protein